MGGQKNDLHRQLITDIRFKMMLLDWTAKDLANATGYSVASIYKLFTRNSKPSRYCAYEVCRIIGIDFLKFKGLWEADNG